MDFQIRPITLLGSQKKLGLDHRFWHTKPIIFLFNFVTYLSKIALEDNEDKREGLHKLQKSHMTFSVKSFKPMIMIMFDFFLTKR